MNSVEINHGLSWNSHQFTGISPLKMDSMKIDHNNMCSGYKCITDKKRQACNKIKDVRNDRL